MVTANELKLVKMPHTFERSNLLNSFLNSFMPCAVLLHCGGYVYVVQVRPHSHHIFCLHQCDLLNRVSMKKSPVEPEEPIGLM